MKHFSKKAQVKLLWGVLALLISLLTHSPAIGLVSGLTLAIILGNNVPEFTNNLAKKLLQLAVILLGFNLSLSTIVSVGVDSLFITATGIGIVFITGFGLNKLFKTEQKLSTLLSTGTAICGGSAIAAVAPAIGAGSNSIAIAMAIVFLLNAIGLIIFPPIGTFLELSQEQFGLWAALAIHDTSSVVGAATIYGTAATAIATTVKLTRALWILPVAFIAAKVHKTSSKAKFPLFLLGFLLASLLNSALPSLNFLWEHLASTGKTLMVTTLFFIGAGLSLKELRKIGLKPLLMAVILWIIVTIGSFFLVKSGFFAIDAVK